MKSNSKLIIYQILLLIFLGLLTGFLFHAKAEAMSMATVISLSGLIALYAICMSFIGEWKMADEREAAHRYTSNRLALLGGTLLLCGGLLYQLFTHNLDHWLLATLVTINVIKIASLIYSNYRN